MKLHTKLLLTLSPLILTACGAMPTADPIPEDTKPTQVPPPVVQQCPEPEVKVVEKIVEVPVKVPTPAECTEPEQAKVAGAKHLPIIGAVEWVNVEPAEFALKARIDSGAETTSIHAENIKLVEKEGKRYVRYTLLNDKTDEKVPMESRLSRTVLIKQHDGEPERRYVVRMWLTLGEINARVDVNLTDREEFEFPLLVGRNFLMDAAIIDVSRQLTQPRKDVKAVESTH